MSPGPVDETAELAPRVDRGGLAPGQQLGKYTLERVLGSGGMGIVWAARDPDLERSVAIKLLHAADASPEQRARLLREARAMARLKHPNVLTVYEVDTDGDRDFIAMELVEGTSLDLWLGARPPAEEVWRAMSAAGRGLAAAHAAGLVHRDFKPHNVLRSRDGRVLVTDFGLARGLGDGVDATAHVPVVHTADPVALGATLEQTPSRKSDTVLDFTLTRPGALIGTPAYMAPEQFLGAPPDPRTDQFAFCVTVWQALTGERPFKGESLDDLRKAASAGVAEVSAKLPRDVRAVLARGLAVDPAERWPDLDALLDALDRARLAPRRRRGIAFAVFGLAMAALAAVRTVLGGHHHDPAPAACEPGFDAWTKERRAAFEKRLDGQPNAIAVADALDQFRDAWLRRYHDACTAGSGAKATARLNCLLGERDDLDGLARLTETVPASALEGFDLWGLLPALEACDGDSPVAPPLLPEDRKLRDQIVAMRSQLAALRLDPARMIAREAELVQHAQKLGWKPLVAEVAVSVGTAAQRLGDDETARARFEAAADEAVRLADFKLEAAARIGLLEVELGATGDPTDPGRAKKLVDQAADAVQRAGGDPAMTNSVDNLRAMYDAAQGALGAAIDRYEHARQKLVALGVLRVAVITAAQEIAALERRDDAGDLDAAWKLGLDTERALAASPRRVARGLLDGAMLELAWRRGELAEVHARADKLDAVRPTSEMVKVAGTVVGPDGAPVAGATVVGWRGRLEADAGRVYTTRGFDGEVAITDATGAFSIACPKTGALIAEHGALRSTVAGTCAGLAASRATVKLAPARTFAGTVATARATGLDASARLESGDAELVVRAPVGRDLAYRIAGVPAGAASLGVEGAPGLRDHKVVHAGPARDGLALAWPDGPALDVIVRTPARDRIEVVVLRGTQVPRTVAELDRRAAESSAAIAYAEPIGLATATAEGRGEYRKGDRHAELRDNAPGEVTICATWSAAGAPVCTTTTVGAEPRAVVLPPAR